MKEYLERISKVGSKAFELMPPLPYHNVDHVVEVYSMTSTLARLHKVSQYEDFILKTGALLHDVLFIQGDNYNEERSADFAKNYLPTIGYSNEETQTVYNLILATKMPQQPHNLLEQIICDADLSNLGDKTFIENGENVRIENNIPQEGWYEAQIKFLQNHNYHTEIARNLLDYGKQENIKKLNGLIKDGGIP